MWPFSSSNALDIASGQAMPNMQLQFGGFAGPTNPVPMPTAQPSATGANRILSNPRLMQALGRMGGAISKANNAGMGFSGSFTTGMDAFNEDIIAQRQQEIENEKIRAQISAFNASAKKDERESKYGVRSQGFEGDMARARVILADPNSSDEDKAIANGVIETASRLQGAYDPVSGDYKWNEKSRFGGQQVPQPAPAPAAAPQALPQPSMQQPAGGMLAPPADVSAGAPAPDGSLFQPTGNRKVDASLMQKDQELRMESEAKRRDKLETSKGEAAADYNSQLSKLPELKATVQELNGLAGTADYTMGSQAKNFVRAQFGAEPTQGAVDRTKYIAMVDNQVLPLLRDTFGSQFTVQEGQSLRATLGDPNKTPAEKKAVLEAFIEQKERNLYSLAKQAGIQAEAPVQNAPGGIDRAAIIERLRKR